MAEEQEFVNVRMSGVSTGMPGRVTRESFEQVWKGRGFVIVDDEEAAMAASPEAEIMEMESEPSRGSRKKG